MGGHQVSSPSRSLVLSLLVIVHQGKTDLGQDDRHVNDPHGHAEAPNGDRDPANLGGAENEREARPQKGLALEPQVLDVVSKRLCSEGKMNKGLVGVRVYRRKENHGHGHGYR